MKKLLLVIVSATIFLLCSCNFDLYGGKRPYDYGDAVWVSSNPDIWFEIDTDREQYYIPEGVMRLDDGRTIPFEIYFVHETNQALFSARLNPKSQYYDCDLSGDCEFFPDKLIIHVNTKIDNVYGGRYETIVFVRQPKDSAGSAAEPSEM